MITSAKFTRTGSILAIIDGEELTVPDDPGNRHRILLSEWEAEGNVIQAYSPPPPTLSDFQTAIQAHVDQVAQSKQYNDAVTLASYDTENQPNPVWKAEASSFVVWRSSVWEYVNAQLLLFEQNQREIPTIEEFLEELPIIEW